MPTGIYKRTEYHRKITSEGVKRAYAEGVKMGFQRFHRINVGKICSEETKIKIANTRFNENNPSWKGDEVKYTSLHQWINRKLGKPKKCEHCGEIEKRLEWANKSREYKRDLTDWISLCISCHKKYDQT